MNEAGPPKRIRCESVMGSPSRIPERVIRSIFVSLRHHNRNSSSNCSPASLSLPRATSPSGGSGGMVARRRPRAGILEDDPAASARSLRGHARFANRRTFSPDSTMLGLLGRLSRRVRHGLGSSPAPRRRDGDDVAQTGDPQRAADPLGAAQLLRRGSLGLSISRSRAWAVSRRMGRDHSQWLLRQTRFQGPRRATIR